MLTGSGSILLLLSGLLVSGLAQPEATPHPSVVAAEEGREPPGTFLSLVWLQLDKLVWVLCAGSLAGLRACGERSF